MEERLACGCGSKEGAGAESRRGEEASFEGAQLDKIAVGGGGKGEHEVHGGGDGGGAAKDAVPVGVVDDDDGGAAIIGQAAEVEKHGLDGGEVVLAGAHEVGESVDDDEAGIQGLGALGEGVGIARVTQVVAAEGDVAEWRVALDLVGAEGGVETTPNLVEARLFVDEEHGAGLDGVAQPGLAGCHANGQIDGEVGFLGAGVAHQEVEAGADKEAVDTPFEGRRILEGIDGLVEDAVFEAAVEGVFGGGVDFEDHVDGEAVDGLDEGLPALDLIGGGDIHDGSVGVDPFGRQAVG